MKLKTLLVVAVAANALLLTTSIAQAKGGGERPAFATLDADGSGEVTLAEMRAHRAMRFAQADANGDGALSLEEMQAKAGERAAKRAERMIERLDANGDGLIQQAEMPARGAERMASAFERLDTDGSGGLSEEEMAKMKGKRGGKKDRGERSDG